MTGLVRVKLYNDWREHRIGEIINVTKDTAKALVEQNYGEYEKPKQKEIKEAPKDKMVKGASVSK